MFARVVDTNSEWRIEDASDTPCCLDALDFHHATDGAHQFAKFATLFRCNAFRSHFHIHFHGKVKYSNLLLFHYSLCLHQTMHTPSFRCCNIFKFIEIYALDSVANIDFQSEANVLRTTTTNNTTTTAAAAKAYL